MKYMSKNGKKVLDKAITFIGVKEYPQNSNNVVFNTDYYGRVVSGIKYPWCCAYVWDVMRLCGLSNLFYDGRKTASCEVLYKWSKANGILTDSPTEGDWVFYQFDNDAPSDHIGFFEKWENSTQFLAIEGNTSIGNDSDGGEVMRRLRKKSQVKGFAHPYKDDVAPIPTPTIPAQVYTKEQFRQDVFAILKVNNINDAIKKSVTISAKKNTKHALVTPLERYFKAWGMYSGVIEADLGKTPSFGANMTKAVNTYQSTILGYKNTDGEITAKGGMWKHMLND